MVLEKEKIVNQALEFSPKDCFDANRNNTPLGSLCFKISINLAEQKKNEEHPKIVQKIEEELRVTLEGAGWIREEASRNVIAYWEYAAQISPHLAKSHDMVLGLLKEQGLQIPLL